MNTLIGNTVPENNFCKSNCLSKNPILLRMEPNIKGRVTNVKISTSLMHRYYVYMYTSKGRGSKR